MIRGTSCDGAVELGTTYRGAGISKRSECQRLSGHRGSCSSEIGFLTVMGQQVRVNVEWDGPSVQHDTPDTQPTPPPRPGPAPGGQSVDQKPPAA